MEHKGSNEQIERKRLDTKAHQGLWDAGYLLFLDLSAGDTGIFTLCEMPSGWTLTIHALLCKRITLQ